MADEVTIQKYIFAIIAFTLVIVGGLNLLAGYKDYDSTYLDEQKYKEFNSTFNKMNELNTTIGGIQEGVTKDEDNFGTFGVLSGLISTAWNALIGMFTSLAFMTDAIVAVAEFTGIPPFIFGIAIMSITIIIAFAIWRAIFQKEI